jgi:hypothetical protein
LCTFASASLITKYAACSTSSGHRFGPMSTRTGTADRSASTSTAAASPDSVSTGG